MTPFSGTETDPSHKLAGLAAAHSEQLFRVMFEQAAVGIALIETATGRFLRVNHRYCEIVGLSPDEMTATTFMAITHPDDLQVDLNNMEKLKAGHIHDFSMEKRYFRADGAIVWVDLTVSPMWERGEQPTFHIAVVQDITPRKQAERNLADLTASLEQQVTLRTHELEKSQQQLQAVVDGISDAVFIKDVEGRYQLFNDAAERFVGKRQEDVIGRDDRFIFPPADAQELMEGDSKIMAGGMTKTYEETVTTAEGAPRTFLTTKGPIFSSHGHMTGLFGIARDITERKQAEEQLRESEERLNQAIHLAKIGIFDHDHRTETLYWSPMMREIYGVPTDEPASLDGYIQLLHPDDRDAIVAAVRQAHDPAGDGLYRVEHRLIRRDGTVRWVSLQSRTHFDGEGPTRKPVRTMGAMVDMTERKRAEEALHQLNETLEQRIVERTGALRASEAFNREILDSLTAHVVVLDASGMIVAVNRVWEKAVLRNDPLGVAQVSLGANYLKVCERAVDTSSEVRPVLDGIVDVLAGRRTLFEREYLCAWPGHKQWFSMRVTPLRDRGGCVITHEDVSNRKRAEDALQDSYHRLQVLSREVQVAEERERARLSRELHDEFGQVLSGLKLELTALANVLINDQAVPASRMKLKQAIGMVDRLFVSLREMVAALRPSVLHELGLVPALEALVTEVQEQAGILCTIVPAQIDLESRWGPEIESALFRIVQELLTNVVRHAGATTATVTLSCTEGQIVLTVQDNGRGLDMRRVGNKKRFGLRGVQERAELLGGTMAVHSRYKAGTTVTIHIPIEVSTSRDAPMVLDRRSKPGSTRKRSRHGH